ncbi:TPA: dUTP diphosphatase [Streptococcus pneumoniae]
MNLTELFETQAALDEHIMQEHPELRGQDNLDWKLLALQVELGECANEWRGFKKWSKDQEPRTVKRIETEWDDDGTPTEWDVYQDVNPLLEEYVDCLHFILSIGLEIECTPDICGEALTVPNSDITNQFLRLMEEAFKIQHNLRFKDMHKDKSALALNTAFSNYLRMLGIFRGLGEMLGFTWQQVEDAYYAKNQINHARQESGY